MWDGIGNVTDRNGAFGNDPTELVPVQCETHIPVDVSENVNGVHGLETEDTLILEIENLLKNRNKEKQSAFIENIISMLKDDMLSKIMTEKKPACSQLFEQVFWRYAEWHCVYKMAFQSIRLQTWEIIISIENRPRV